MAGRQRAFPAENIRFPAAQGPLRAPPCPSVCASAAHLRARMPAGLAASACGFCRLQLALTAHAYSSAIRTARFALWGGQRAMQGTRGSGLLRSPDPCGVGRGRPVELEKAASRSRPATPDLEPRVPCTACRTPAVTAHPYFEPCALQTPASRSASAIISWKRLQAVRASPSRSSAVSLGSLKYRK